MLLEGLINTMVDKYVITTAQYNAGVNKQLLKTIDKYCNIVGAELLILPTIGKSIREEPLLAEELQTRNILTRDYNINNNLRIKDFGVRPQQINPLTGLGRFAQGDKS